MSESSPWTVDHPLVQAIWQSLRRLELGISLETVCRILQGIDKHRRELRLEADDPRIHETLDAMDAIAAESDQSEEIVWAVVMAYSGAVGAGDLSAPRYTADHPAVQELANILSLRPAIVSAVLRRDHDFFAREGLDEKALLGRVMDAVLRVTCSYFGLPPEDAP